MHTKITAIVFCDYADSDLISIMRSALLKEGIQIDSIDVEAIPGEAVLYALWNDEKRYVLAIPSRSDHIDWTSDIDAAKVCNGPRSIQQCRTEIMKRTGITTEILYI